MYLSKRRYRNSWGFKLLFLKISLTSNRWLMHYVNDGCQDWHGAVRKCPDNILLVTAIPPKIMVLAVHSSWKKQAQRPQMFQPNGSQGLSPLPYEHLLHSPLLRCLAAGCLRDKEHAEAARPTGAWYHLWGKAGRAPGNAAPGTRHCADNPGDS